jgi:hypothetical protein
MADRMIGSCGIVCTECPAYIARRTGDDGLREHTAAEWSKQYGADIPPEAVDCDGCLASDGVQIGHCAECEIRACSQQTHDVENCGLCGDYPCDRITAFFEYVPSAREVLDGVSRGA